MEENNDINQQVIDIVCDTLSIIDKSKVTTDMDIGNDLMADDLDLVAIVMELEKKFDIKIKDELIDSKFASNTCTIKYLVTLINALRSKKSN